MRGVRGSIRFGLHLTISGPLGSPLQLLGALALLLQFLLALLKTEISLGQRDSEVSRTEQRGARGRERTNGQDSGSEDDPLRFSA